MSNLIKESNIYIYVYIKYIYNQSLQSPTWQHSCLAFLPHHHQLTPDSVTSPTETSVVYQAAIVVCVCVCSRVLLKYKKEQRKLLTQTSEGGTESAPLLVPAREL